MQSHARCHSGPRSDRIIRAAAGRALTEIARLLDAGHRRPRGAKILPLDQAGRAHQMLEGEPHEVRKIVLRVAA
jgi:NADPH:quinone reductase-like Zn-dependent oxidoreductase